MRQLKNPPEILSGWKEIACHLGKGVRTVQRYERELGLPIRRAGGKLTGSVIATKVELDAWVIARPLRDAFQLTQAAADSTTLLHKFRRNLLETHRLRNETVELRAQVRASLELLQENLRSALPQQNQAPKNSLGPHLLADAQAFDPKKNVM